MLLSHIRHLPAESAFQQAQQDSWPAAIELAAQTVDSLNHLTYVTAKLGGADVHPVARLRRPTDEPDEPPTHDEIVNFLRE